MQWVCHEWWVICMEVKCNNSNKWWCACKCFSNLCNKCNKVEINIDKWVEISWENKVVITIEEKDKTNTDKDKISIKMVEDMTNNKGIKIKDTRIEEIMVVVNNIKHNNSKKWWNK